MSYPRPPLTLWRRLRLALARHARRTFTTYEWEDGYMVATEIGRPGCDEDVCMSRRGKLKLLRAWSMPEAKVLP